MIVKQKVDRFEASIKRALELKKRMVDAEITMTEARAIMRIKHWDKFERGEYPEGTEKPLIIALDKVPKSIIDRDKPFKTFKKTLLDMGITSKDVETKININREKVYRILKGITRDKETEKAIEKAIGKKIF